MKTLTKLTLIILTAAFACSANANKFYSFDSTQVMRDFDGDTIDLRVPLSPFSLMTHIRVRLLGINAWESRISSADEKVKGLIVKKRLTELTEDSVTLCLTKKDKYGRWLGELFKGKSSVNERMLIKGHAHPYFRDKRKAFIP